MAETVVCQLCGWEGEYAVNMGAVRCSNCGAYTVLFKDPPKIREFTGVKPGSYYFGHDGEVKLERKFGRG